MLVALYAGDGGNLGMRLTLAYYISVRKLTFRTVMRKPYSSVSKVVPAKS